MPDHDSKSSLRILGIDPGLRVTGYAVVEADGKAPRVCEAGIIKSELTGPNGRAGHLADRLHNLYTGIVDVCSQFQPGVVVVEQLYSHYKHPRTAILMGHARGVIFLAASQRGLPVVSYSATRIKKTITGNGHASKEQIQRTIQRELNLVGLPEPADVADALAAALCHFHAQKNLG